MVLPRIALWYKKYERIISTLFLLLGFVFNAVVLKRVDLFWENFWVAVHILTCALAIAYLNIENKSPKIHSEKIEAIVLYVLQFTFGGLISTFLVFYFRSAVLAVAWPFLLVLVIAFFLNESFKHKYTRMDFQILFLFLSTYLYLSFLVPLIANKVNALMFFVAGGITTVLIVGFILIIRTYAPIKYASERKTVITSVIGVLILFNGFYVLNVIPPLPLSLRDAGIFHTILKNDNGTYTITKENYGFFESFRNMFGNYSTYHANIPIAYAYSSIFAPSYFTPNIIHEWQLFDSATKNWTTKFTTTLHITGGREDGFRTYSAYGGIFPGKWRVNVRLPDGPVIGRMMFDISSERIDASRIITSVIE